MNDIHSIIEAFADNEPVDPGRLKDALAAPEGRDYLVDLLVLRGLVGGDGEYRLTPAAALPRPVSRARRWSAAAAIAAVSVVGGYYAGQQWAPAASVDEAAAGISTSAPEPTRVIKLEDSADWIDRVGED
jgi:hypothetical protein